MLNEQELEWIEYLIGKRKADDLSEENKTRLAGAEGKNCRRRYFAMSSLRARDRTGHKLHCHSRRRRRAAFCFLLDGM